MNLQREHDNLLARLSHLESHPSYEKSLVRVLSEQDKSCEKLRQEIRNLRIRQKEQGCSLLQAKKLSDGNTSSAQEVVQRKQKELKIVNAQIDAARQAEHKNNQAV